MDPIIDFLIYIAFFAAGYFYRHFLFINQLASVIRQTNKTKNENKVFEIDLTLNQLTHEIIGTEHYFYSAADKSFVCQAPDLDQAAKKYLTAESESSIGWFIHCADNKKYCFANGEVKEIADE